MSSVLNGSSIIFTSNDVDGMQDLILRKVFSWRSSYFTGYTKACTVLDVTLLYESCMISPQTWNLTKDLKRINWDDFGIEFLSLRISPLLLFTLLRTVFKVFLKFQLIF